MRVSLAGPDPRPISVLVVDDQADVAESLALFLSIVGDYRVRVARDGAEGIRLAREQLPDVVVSDIGLPKQDGFEVARKLAGLTPRPLLIAVTACGDADVRERAAAAGYDYFLAKPADPHHVEALLRTHRGRAPSAI